MIKIKFIAKVLNDKGHDVILRQYIKPCNGRSVYYITSIDGVIYKTNQQDRAKKKLNQLLMEEFPDDK